MRALWPLALLLGACAHPPLPAPPPTPPDLVALTQRSPIAPTLRQVAPLLKAAVAAMSAHLHHDPERLPLTEAAIDTCLDPHHMTAAIADRLRASLSPQELQHIAAAQPRPTTPRPTPPPPSPRRDAALQVLASHYNTRATLRRLWVSLYSNAALIALTASTDPERDRDALRLIVAGAVRRTGVERLDPQQRLRDAYQYSPDEEIERAAAFWASPTGQRYQIALWRAYTDTLDEGADCAIRLLR